MELLFDYKIKVCEKCFVDVVYSVAELKRNKFVLSVKVLLFCSNKLVNTPLCIDRRFGLTILTFCKRDCSLFLKLEQWRS